MQNVSILQEYAGQLFANMDADQLSQPENSPEAILKAYVEVGDIEEYNDENLAEIRKAWWERYHQLNGYVLVWRWEEFSSNGGEISHKRLHHVTDPIDRTQYGCAWTAAEAFYSEEEMQERIKELEQQEC